MLVSFVVSTATGIMTVAMLEEAPQTLTQTVNRVVERTIERVVTGTSTPEKATPVTTVTKEVTIYAKEDDLVVTAVEKNQPRIAKIFGANTATTSVPDAIGFVVSRDGMVATDAATLSRVNTSRSTNPNPFTVMVGEKTYTGTIVEKAEYADSPVTFLRLALADTETLDAVSFGPVGTEPKVAQTAVVLGGEYGLEIFKATLTKLVYGKPNATSSSRYVGSIETSPRIPEGYEGALVVNLDGQAVGIAVSTATGKPLEIYPTARILSLMMLVTPPAASASVP